MKKTRLIAICDMIFSFLERDDLTSFSLAIKEMGEPIKISKPPFPQNALQNGKIKIGRYEISYELKEEEKKPLIVVERKVEVCLLKKSEVIYWKVFNEYQGTISIMLPKKF